MAIKAPFPYFGGKSAIAGQVWRRFGDPPNYVEPFCGSCAMLLSRPSEAACETVNDADGLICNFWRAVRADPEAVAHHADWPVNENDLHARHSWLVGQKDTLQSQLEGNPEYFDVKVAGWWCWGMCCWIGSGFCSGHGPWQVVDGQLVHLGTKGQGVNRKLVHLGTKGQGVNRQRVHLGDKGRGVNRKRENLTNDGVGITARRLSRDGLIDWMQAIADRFRNVRVCCGDWARVTGPTPTIKQGVTAMFLDPPYAAQANRQSDLYRVDDESIAVDVRQYCLDRGGDKMMRALIPSARIFFCVLKS